MHAGRETQCEKIKQVLANYDDIFQDKPGRTDKVEHRIPTGTAKLIRLPPYCLPHAYRSEVRNEIEDMLRSCIIDPATGEWSAAVIVVKKKDGSLRLCRLQEIESGVNVWTTQVLFDLGFDQGILASSSCSWRSS